MSVTITSHNSFTSLVLMTEIYCDFSGIKIELKLQMPRHSRMSDCRAVHVRRVVDKAETGQVFRHTHIYRKNWLLISSYLSFQVNHRGFYWTDFCEIWHFWGHLQKSANKIQIWLSLDKNTGYFTWKPKRVGRDVYSAKNKVNALLCFYDYTFNIYYIFDSNICMPRTKVAYTP
jgi:hypothetical protein